MRRAGRDRGELLAAAGEVVASRGADATRFADVTAATGVGVSTLQYYFGSREDMLVAVFRHAASSDFEAVGELIAGLDDPWLRLSGIATRLSGATGGLPGWRLWVESWRWALRDPEVRADVLGDYTRWHELIAAEVERGVTAGVFKTARPPLDVARQILAVIDGLALPVALGAPGLGGTGSLLLATIADLAGADVPAA